jgi:hypothetical protein
MIFVETKMHAKMKRESLFYFTTNQTFLRNVIFSTSATSSFGLRKSEINHQKSKIFFNHIVNCLMEEIIGNIETCVYINLKRTSSLDSSKYEINHRKS